MGELQEAREKPSTLVDPTRLHQQQAGKETFSDVGEQLPADTFSS